MNQRGFWGFLWCFSVILGDFRESHGSHGYLRGSQERVRGSQGNQESKGELSGSQEGHRILRRMLPKMLQEISGVFWRFQGI